MAWQLQGGMTGDRPFYLDPLSPSPSRLSGTGAKGREKAKEVKNSSGSRKGVAEKADRARCVFVCLPLFCLITRSRWALKDRITYSVLSFWKDRFQVH